MKNIGMGIEKNDKVARLMTLDEIFEGRFFCIPDYQRGYSWEQTQVKDLLNDIEHLGNTDYIHFTGTIVASCNKKNDVHEIVDGQQRLTTLIIIIHECLHKEIKNKKLIIERYSKIGNIGNEKQKFIVNTESKDFFDHVIINNDTKTLQPSINSHENMLEAKKNINKWLSKQNDINKILNIVCARLGFIFYRPEHTKEIGIMFEVINNRGKPLSQLEKIKNFLIYYSVKMDLSNLHDAVNDKWGTILRNLSLANKSSSEDETNFLRYCWLVYFDKGKKKSHDVYAELKKRFPFNNDTLKDDTKKENFNLLNSFINFLELSSKNYEQYFNEYSIKSEDDKVQSIAKTLKSLKSQGSYASIMPLVLAVMAKATDEEQAILLDIIEKLNFRVYILPNVTHRADSGQGDLFGYAFKFYHEYDEYKEKVYIQEQNDKEVEYKNIIDWLDNKLKEFVENYCTEEKIKESLINQDDRYNFYKWRGLRYFLMSYEESLNRKKTIDIERILLGRNDKKVNDYYSIEHYWAIKNRNYEGENNRPQDKSLKNRLGNLGLLEMGINIQAGDKDLSKKLKIYFGENESKDSSDLKQIAKAKDVFENFLNKYKPKKRTKDSYYYSMYEEFIESMEKEYVDFALNRWQLK